MALVPLQNVRYLTLREIAEMWAPEAGVPMSLMLRELRIAVINIPRLRDEERILDVPPPDEELPDPDERVDRPWLMEFCVKEGWSEPEFWFGKQEPEYGYPGRPTVKPAIVQELERLNEQGELEDTLAEQARVLSEWAKKKFPGKHTPQPKVVGNQIREQFKRLKQSH